MNAIPICGWMKRLLCAVTVGLGLAWLPEQGRGGEAPFVIGGVTLTLAEAGNDAEIFYQAVRLNRALNAWNVEVWVTNKSARPLEGPLVLRVESFSGTTGPVQPDGLDGSARAYYDLSAMVPQGMLLPGQKSAPRTLTLGMGEGTPSLNAQLFVKPANVLAPAALVRSLNEVGQPLPGVQVIDLTEGSTNSTDSTFGVASLGGGAGEHVWKFVAPGFVPVWRQQTLATGEVAVVLSPRLTPQAPTAVTLTPLGGGQVQDGTRSLQLQFSPGAFSQDTRVRVTALTAQTLPALLPQGWSPLQAFWLELANEPAIAGSATLHPWGPLGSGETAALAKWNETNLRWEVLQLLVGNGTNSLTAALSASGAYALVVGDPGLLAPPPPQVGQALAGSAASLPDVSLLSATGKVEPASSPASRIAELVTATASVTISNRSGSLPSGLMLRGEVEETYSFRNGTRRVTPQYEQFIVGYQRPGDGSLATLEAAFPMRPLLLFGAEELDQALVHLEVVGPSGFSGGVIDASGGQITLDGLRLLAGAGDLSGVQAVQVRNLNPTNFSDLAVSGVSIVRAFDLIAGSVVGGRKLVAQFDGLATNSLFVLAKVLSKDGLCGLEPRERLASDALGRLSSLEPVSAPKLPGISGAGQYVLAQVTAPQGLVIGTARNAAGQAASGLPVWIEGAPWLTFSEANGGYQLVASTGAVQIAVTDLTTGDRGLVSTVLTDLQVGTAADIASVACGPIATLLTPTNGASSVPRVSPIVVAFSQAINPGSLGTNGLQLLGVSNTVVKASLSLNLKNTVATLLPVVPLAPSTLYTLLVSTNITDLNGRPLAGTNLFTFSSATDVLNRSGAQLISYEPTNGVARMVGSPGFADPNSPVILVNETSGRTATVLAGPDGSITNYLEAEVDDFLSAVLVNENGTRTTVPLSRQIYRDGSVGLFNGGGILEAQSDGGPVQILVEPGAIPGKTKFTLEAISLTELLQLVQGTQPTNGNLLAGFRLRSEGDALQTEVQVSLGVNEAALGLPPGKSPDDVTFALTAPRTVDGVVVYEVLDRMQYDEGKLITSSAAPAQGLVNQAQADRPPDLALAPQPVAPPSPRRLGLNSTSLSQGLALSIIQLFNVTVAVQGTLYSADRDASGDWNTSTQRPVRSATVFGVPPAAARTGGVGRVPAGSTVGITDEEGEFAFLIEGEWMENGVFPLRGRSAFFPGQLANGMAQHSGGANARGSVYFDRGGTPATLPDLVPPTLRMYHQPNLPGVGENAAFNAFAIDNRDVPTLTVQVDQVAPLVSGVTPASGDVSLLQVTQQITGQSVFQSYQVRSTKAAAVTLAVNAVDPSGNANFSRYRLNIGAGWQNPTNTSNLDTNGPFVIYSDPDRNVDDFNPHAPIVLRFNEPVHERLLANLGSVVTLSPDAGTPNGQLSPDQRELKLWFPRLADSTAYSLTLGNGITDLHNNPFDQDPDTTSYQEAFNFPFSTRQTALRSLGSLNNGGGIAGDTNVLFALDRKGPTSETGWLVCFRRQSSGVTFLSRLQLPSYPRELVYIPNYSFYNAQMSPTTEHLVVIVGGEIGGAGQWLWVVNVTDPAHPSCYLSTLVSRSPSAAIARIARSGARLGYLEFEPGADSIGLIDLQLLLYAHLKPSLINEPVEGREGLDKNGDGDYVDPGDLMPLPRRMPGRAATVAEAGMVAQFTLGEDSVQHITDFSLGLNGRFVGAIYGPDNQGASAGYRTLALNDLPLAPSVGVLNLARQPDRLFTLFGVLLKPEAAPARYANLALISGGSARTNLTVVEITDPAHPVLLAEIPISSDHGDPRSMTLTPSGWVLLACTRDMLLLDPSRLLLPMTGPEHPAVVGVVAGGGGSLRSFVGDETGFTAVAEGGRALFNSVPPAAANFQATILTATDWNEGADDRQSTNNWLEIVASENQTLLFVTEHNPPNKNPPPDWPTWVLDNADRRNGRTVLYDIPGYSLGSAAWYLPLSPPQSHAAVCEGQSLTVKVYPQRKREFKLQSPDVEDKVDAAKEAIKAALQALRAGAVAVDLDVEPPKGQITFAHEWKECPTNNKVSLAMDLNMQFDPLIGIKGKVGYGFLPPAPLNRYIEAQIYLESFLKLKGRGTFSRNECGQLGPGAVFLEAEGGVAVGAEAKVGSVFEASVSGESKFAASGDVVPETDGIHLKNFKVDAPGLSAKFTIKTAGGWLEYENEIPIFPATTLYTSPDDLVLKRFSELPANP